jgi:hypothetical protein
MEGDGAAAVAEAKQLRQQPAGAAVSASLDVSRVNVAVAQLREAVGAAFGRETDGR